MWKEKNPGELTTWITQWWAPGLLIISHIAQKGRERSLNSKFPKGTDRTKTPRKACSTSAPAKWLAIGWPNKIKHCSQYHFTPPKHQQKNYTYPYPSPPLKFSTGQVGSWLSNLPQKQATCSNFPSQRYQFWQGQADDAFHPLPGRSRQYSVSIPLLTGVSMAKQGASPVFHTSLMEAGSSSLIPL